MTTAVKKLWYLPEVVDGCLVSARDGSKIIYRKSVEADVVVKLRAYVGNTSVHLLTAVAIQSVDFSVQSLFIPDSSGAVIKASLEMHAQKTSPS